MGIKCDIKTDQVTYCPGQTVKCNVQLDFDSPVKKIKNISVRFKGEAGTKWTRGAAKNSITFTAEQEYFRHYTYIVGSKDSGNDTELSAGTHNYSVQFTLPTAIPSSFVERHGYIRYTIKVHVDVAWAFDSKFVVEFNVCAPLDLNKMPETQLPVCIEESKRFTICCIPLGGIYRLTFSMPYSGFCNDQKIPICLECVNNSNVYVKGLKVALRKLITYHSEIPHAETKRDDIKVAVLKFQVSVDKQQTKQFSGELTVPAKTATNLANCSIIQISHRLEVITELSGCHSNYVFDVPVTIGHVGPVTNGSLPIYMPSKGAMGQGPPSYDIAMRSSTSVVPPNI
ncbi:arrestin domain-containing protein 17-like [Culicoides brevitarsis]|uniref:arrestin domain-containing protein 17-like n=1 Tax=Culicoides brevitarsis TaxID=469753 RepID=UPI00307B3051